MKRRHFIKTFFKTTFGLISMVALSFIYAHYLEPRKIVHQKTRIISHKIPKSFNDLKIVQFTDTHLGFHYSLEQFSTLIKRINNENPDIVVFTGDLIDRPQTFSEKDALVKLLKSIETRLGKFWVFGNHDHGGYGTKMVKDVLTTANFKLLNNQHINLSRDHEQITIAGIDDAILGQPNFEQTFNNIEKTNYTILLAHEPDLADYAVKYPVDLQLSGHSHGGQIRLPFIGHLYTPPYARKYIRGKYVLKERQMKLFVSSGIGTTRLPLRFLCQPEFHTFVLQSKNV